MFASSFSLVYQCIQLMLNLSTSKANFQCKVSYTRFAVVIWPTHSKNKNSSLTQWHYVNSKLSSWIKEPEIIEQLDTNLYQQFHMPTVIWSGSLDTELQTSKIHDTHYNSSVHYITLQNYPPIIFQAEIPTRST